MARARAEGFSLVLLVGDMPYYGRFGFNPVPPGQITLPGPVDPARLLSLELVPGRDGGRRRSGQRLCASVTFAEPGGGEKTEKKAEREKSGEERKQAHALDLIGVALVQPEPIVAMHDLTAAQHDETRQLGRLGIVTSEPEDAAAGLFDEGAKHLVGRGHG